VLAACGGEVRVGLGSAAVRGTYRWRRGCRGAGMRRGAAWVVPLVGHAAQPCLAGHLVSVSGQATSRFN
jgi:hypothetical protein